MKRIKQILFKNKPHIILMFENGEVRSLDVSKLGCSECMEKFEQAYIDEFEDLHWDIVHGLDADTAYKLSSPINIQVFVDILKSLPKDMIKKDKLEHALKMLLE